MHFTREPIIETIITPKEGYKLIVRSSKGAGHEEYSVDAVEVVSFGHSFFFRSTERPGSFLVPVGDYEVVELKEARVILKNASIDRAIKIGGGREASLKVIKEEKIQEIEVRQDDLSINPEQAASIEAKPDKKRDRRRHRRKRLIDEKQEGKEITEKPEEEGFVKAKKEFTVAQAISEGGGAQDEAPVSSSMFSTLFPPPPTLISQTLGRYKERDTGAAEGNFFPKVIEQSAKEEKEEPQEKGEKVLQVQEEINFHKISIDSETDPFI